MPAVIPAIAAAAASDFVATAVAAEIGAGFLATAAGAVAGGIASYAVASALAPSAQQSQQSSIQTQRTPQVALVNTTSSFGAINPVYGSRKVGGVRIFTEMSGANDEYLNLVIVWGAGPISAINTVYLDDIASNDSTFTGLVTIENYTGTDTQAASAALIAEVPAKWTAAHQLRGVAYSYIKLKWDETAFPRGMPVITADIDGMLVYDPRDTTTKFSNNPWLCIRDYLTNTRYGVKAPTSMIDDATFITEANFCDALVSVPAAGGTTTQKRYTCDGVINIDQGRMENLRALMSSCRGFLVFSGGQYKARSDAVATPTTFALNENNIVGAWSFKMPSKRTRYNRVRANFFDEDNFWQPNVAVQDSTVYRTTDGETLLESSIDLPFTVNTYRAGQIAQQVMKQSRYGLVVSLTATIAATQLEVGDVVPLTHSTPGWTAKNFRVWQMSPLANDEVRLTLQEYNAAVYTLDDLVYVNPVSDSNLPNPRIAGAPGVPSITESLYETSGSAGVKAKATVSWAAAVDQFVVSGGNYQVDYQLSGASSWTPAGQVKSNFTTLDVMDLAPGTYVFRVRSINAAGAASSYAQATKEILGLTAPPSDLTSFSLTPFGNQADISWDKSVDLDVRIGGRILVRWSPKTSGAVWNDGVEVANTPGDATTARVAHLTGTYMGRAQDSSGNQSTNIVSVITTAPDVTGYNAISSLTEDATFTGAKSSTVVVGSVLQLDAGVAIDSVTDLADAWGYVDSLGGLAATGTYDFSTYIDTGATYTSRVTATLKTLSFDTGDSIDARLEPVDDWGLIDGPEISDVDANLFIATTTDDPAGTPTWSSWRPFMIGDYKARAFKFRLVLTSQHVNHNISVINLGVAVDMPDREDAARNVSSGAGTKTVTYTLSPTFKALPKIGITAKNMGTGDYFTISNELVGSFDIIFKNAAAAAVDRTFDWRAKGY